MTKPSIAILVPCHNEETTIGKVVDDFRAVLPDATVYVFDNASTDSTSSKAREHGAVVRSEPSKGKGNAVRRAFADVDSDIYVLVDGDDTYDASAALAMIAAMSSQSLDMVNAVRVPVGEDAFRQGHRFGNRLLNRLVSFAFGKGSVDMLSGYRVLSRRFVKSFPIVSGGFELETEMTVHALQLGCPFVEMRSTYRARPVGSQSKLATYRDGINILRMIVTLVREELPMAFFATLSFLFASVALVLAFPLLLEYFASGLVPRFPTAILVMGLMVLASLSMVCGLVLSTVTRARNELKRLHYLAIPAPMAEE